MKLLPTVRLAGASKEPSSGGLAGWARSYRLLGGLCGMLWVGAVVAQTPLALPALPALADPNAIRVQLSPEVETTLVSQMDGRIITLNASLGSPVKRGGMVAAFDCNESGARLNMARAELTSATETRDVKRQLRVLEAAGATEVSLAEAEFNRAQAAVALSRAQSAHCSVSAPFTGRVVKIHVRRYQSVQSGTPLVDLVSDGPLKLRLNVPSRLLRTLKVGTPFEVDIDETGRSYPAKVTAINARVDAVARTVELEGALEGKPQELLAGMTGIARFAEAP